MASKLKLQNNINTEFSLEHSDNKPAGFMSSHDISRTVDTVTDMEALIPAGATASAYDKLVCVVRDLDRGGTFIYDSTKVTDDNQGTNFSGWVRQYSGAVNVKWFGAKDIREYPDYDSSGAFNKCIEAVVGTEGIEFPVNGQFICGTIKVFNKTYIEFNNSILFCKKDEGMFYNTADEVEISLENVIIDMRGSIFTKTERWYNQLYAINIRYPNHSIFRNIKISNAPTVGFCVGSVLHELDAVEPYDSRSIIDNLTIETTGLSSTDNTNTGNKGLKIDAQKNIVITNSSFYNCKGQSLHTVNSENILVSKCVSTDSTDGGIWLSYGTTGSTIENCISINDADAAYGLSPGHYIQDVGNGAPNRLLNSYAYSPDKAVAVAFGNFVIENNVFYAGSNGVCVKNYNASQNKNIPQLGIIKNNTINAIGTTSLDGILFDNVVLTTHITNYKNIYIENNVISDFVGRGIKFNVYNDIPTLNINIKNNTIINTSQDCISLTNVDGATISNNIGKMTDTSKYLLASGNTNIDFMQNNNINTTGKLFYDVGTTTIKKVDEKEFPFYQTGIFTATGDGSATDLVFNYNDMKSNSVTVSTYQVDENFEAWALIGGPYNNHLDMKFDTAPANGELKKFFFELKSANYTS